MTLAHSLTIPTGRTLQHSPSGQVASGYVASGYALTRWSDIDILPEGKVLQDMYLVT